MTPSQELLEVVHKTPYTDLTLDSQASASQDGESRAAASQARHNLQDDDVEPEDEGPTVIQSQIQSQTQVQASLVSRVDDTQFVNIEKDTQPPPDVLEASQVESQAVRMQFQALYRRLGPEAVPHSPQILRDKSQPALMPSQDHDQRSILPTHALHGPREASLVPFQPATNEYSHDHDRNLATSEPAGFFLNRSEPTESSPPAYKWAKAPPYEPNRLTRFHSENNAPALAHNDTPAGEISAPRFPDHKTSNEALSTRSGTGSHGTSEQRTMTSVIQTTIVHEVTPNLHRIVSSNQSAVRSRIPSVPSPVQPVTVDENVLPIRPTLSALKDFEEAAIVSVPTNTISAGSRKKIGRRRMPGGPFAGFIPEDDSTSEHNSSSTAVDNEPKAVKGLESQPSNDSKGQTPHNSEYEHNHSHGVDEPENLEGTDFPFADLDAKKLLTSQYRNQDILTTRKESYNERSRNHRISGLPAVVVAEPHYKPSAPSPVHSKVLASASHGSGTNLPSDLGSAHMDYVTPRISRMVVRPQNYSMSPRMTRVRSKGHSGTGSVARETLKHSAAHRQDVRQTEVDLPPLGAKILVQPFPEQKTAPRHGIRSQHKQRQIIKAPVPAGSPPAANSANDRRQRTSTTASPLFFTGAKRTGTPGYDAISVVSNDGQQAPFAQDKPQRHESGTGVSHVLNEKDLARCNSALDDGDHDLATRAANLHEERELSPSESSSHNMVPDEDLEMETVDGVQCGGQDPEISAQVEAVVEEVDEHDFGQVLYQESDRHHAQCRLQRGGPRSMNEDGIMQEQQPNLENYVQQPQSSSRERSRCQNMKEVDDPHYEHSRSHPQQAGVKYGDESRHSNVPRANVEDHFQHFQPPSRAQSQDGSVREIDDNRSQPEYQQNDENQSQQPPVLSRSESRRSNIGTPISSRPVRPGDLAKVRKPTPVMGVQNAPKIQKSTSCQNEAFTMRKASLEERQRIHAAKEQELRQEEENLRSEQSKADAERKLEIQELRNANTQAEKTIVQLQKEKKEQEERLARFKKTTMDYRKHINDVVRMQDFLSLDSNRIKARTAKAVAEAREVRNLLVARERQEKAVTTCRKQANRLHSEIVASNIVLERQLDELKESQNSLQSLEKDLRHRLELETAKTKGLEKQIEITSTGRQEFAQILTEIPGSVANELIKKDGLLAKLLFSETSTQSKVDEVIASITYLKDATSKPSLTLTKALEDFFTKFENKLSPPSNNESDPAARIVEDLKTHFDKVLIDIEAQDKLKEHIIDIEERNTALKSTNETQANTLQGLTSKIEELEQSLEATKREVEEKTRELHNLRANPPENPLLVKKVHDLEKQCNTGQQKVDAAAQDSAKDKQELIALRESIARQEEHVKQLGQTINSMNEEKSKAEEASNLASQKLRQEHEKAQLESKTMMQQEHQAALKTWEQEKAEVEFALDQSREETQKALREHNQTQSERDRLKGFVTQVEARLQQAEQQRPGVEESNNLRTQLHAAEQKLTAIQLRFQSLSETLSKQDEINALRYQDCVQQLNIVDQLERSNEALAQQNLNLKNQNLVPRAQTVERRPIKPAQRKPSSQYQRPEKYTIQVSGDGKALTSPQTMAPPEKRPEKGVTFANQPSYSEPLASPHSPLDLNYLYDDTGRLIPHRLRATHKKMANEKINGTPRRLEDIQPSGRFSGDSGHAFTRKNNTYRNGQNVPIQEGSRSAEVPSSESNEMEAIHGQDKPLKSALKSRPQQAPGSETALHNITPTFETTDMPQAQKASHTTYAREKAHILRNVTTVKAHTAGTSAKIIAGRSATTHLGNRPVTLDSPRQGMSASYTTQSIHGKRPAPPGTEAHAPKRRASAKRSLSQRSRTSSGVIPDSQ